MSSYSLSHLSDDAVTRALHTAAEAERQSDASLLAHIAEFDRRRLFLPTRFPSTFRYCVGELRMSEDMAYKRVHVARAARRFPIVFKAIADGRLNLSGAKLLAPHLTRGNAEELVAEATHKTRAEMQALLAGRLALARAMAPTGSTPAASEVALPAAGASEAADFATMCGEQAPGPVGIAGVYEAPAPISLPQLHVRVTPIAPGRYELVGVIGQESYEALMASRELLGHVVPSGNLAEVLERAIALQHAQLRKRRCGATDRPRVRAAKPGGHGASGASKPRPANPRHVPSAVRDAVWERDGGQCTFVGTGGHRCGSRDALELDHIEPVARGGQSTVANLRLMCRAHNQYVAEQTFGRDVVRGRREAAKRRRTEERLRKAAERERTEARKREIARQCEELGEALRNLGYRGDDQRRALAYCAERADASPEERLRHALGCMAPNARRELPSASFPDLTSGACDGDGTVRAAIASGEGGASSASIAC